MSPLQVELSELLNRHSRGNRSDTPDFILAELLMEVLTAYESAVQRRESWHNGEDAYGKAQSETKKVDSSG